MKKLLCAILCLILLTPALAETLANPWAETTADGVRQALGVEFGVPDGATNLRYAMLAEDGLAEFTFTWYGMDYTARIMPADAFTDISGLYYEWNLSADWRIQGCESRVLRAYADDRVVDLCLWYDAGAGLMYSVTASGDDLDGFDITASAEALYLPSAE